MNTKEQLLLDINIEPNDKMIASCLGNTNNTYINFIKELNKNDISLMKWRYYKDGKAWLSKGEYEWTTPRGINKVKTIFWLSIWKDFFKISFFFSHNIKEILLKLPLSEETKNIIKETNPMGKMMRFMPVTFDVSNNNQLNDIFILANFKKSNK